MSRTVFSAMLAIGWVAAASAAPLSPPDEASAERTEEMCKLTAQESAKSGKALESAVQECVTADSPALGYWEHCRAGARRRHLDGTALRADVAACMSREQ